MNITLLTFIVFLTINTNQNMKHELVSYFDNANNVEFVMNDIIISLNNLFVEDSYYKLMLPLFDVKLVNDFYNFHKFIKFNHPP